MSRTALVLASVAVLAAFGDGVASAEPPDPSPAQSVPGARPPSVDAPGNDNNTTNIVLPAGTTNHGGGNACVGGDSLPDQTFIGEPGIGQDELAGRDRIAQQMIDCEFYFEGNPPFVP